MTQSQLRVAAAGDRKDLATFLDRVLRLDDVAVVRLRRRSEGKVSVWAATQFDVLVCRVVAAEFDSGDCTLGADQLLHGLREASVNGEVDTGYRMDSAWRGALPADTGFEHLDDIPARSVVELGQRGGLLAREHGSAHGPPVSLLDQPVVSVDGLHGSRVDVPMRCVFALMAMAFIPPNPLQNEPVRVRSSAAWLRLDARFGSVYRHRADLSVLT